MPGGARRHARLSRRLHARTGPQVLHGPADIACHLSKGFAEGNRAEQRSCTGVAVYRANCGLKPLGANAMDAVRHVKPNRELVFASPAEFLRHHKGEPPE